MSNNNDQITFDKNVLQYVKYSRVTDNSILNDDLIKSYDHFGSLLHYAASACNSIVVQQLIDLGSEVDLVGQNGQTPFMLAVHGYCNGALGKIFLKAKANIDITDNNGRSVLQRVLANFTYDSPLVKVFVSKLKTKRTTPDDMAKRLIAAGCQMYEAATFRDVQVLQCMLDHGVDVNSESSHWNRTALHRAAEMDDVDIANWLIDNGADVDAQDERAASVVHLAATLRHKGVLKILLERGADPNYKDSDCGYSPLVSVCVNRNKIRNLVSDTDECVKLLLQHDAILEKSLRKNRSIFDYALDSCGDETIKMLIGQLAMLEMLGMSITNKVMYCKLARHRSKLPEFEEYRQLCLQVLTIKLVQDLSLSDLLNIRDSRLNSLVRRKTFASNVKRACSKLKLSKSHYYYYDTLMMRIDKAGRIVKLEDKAILAVCKLFRCSYNQCHNFAREIVSYLIEFDLERLIQV